MRVATLLRDRQFETSSRCRGSDVKFKPRYGNNYTCFFFQTLFHSRRFHIIIHCGSRAGLILSIDLRRYVHGRNIA